VESTPTQPFPTHARAVVRSIRGSFTEAIASGGADPTDCQSIGRSLGLNKNLAWKISRIIQDEDPSSVLMQMPGAGGLKIFLRAVESAGIEPKLVRSAQNAISEYEELIKLHSGDRTTFDMMCAELGPAGRSRLDEQNRKQLFQGGSAVWGVQARVNLKVGVIGPGAAPGLIDFVSVNALIDFRRIRPDATWVMATRQAKNDDGTQMPTAPREAIDPAFADPEVAPLMGEFCSSPLPELRRVADVFGTSFVLPEGPVGNAGSLTCVVGVIHREILAYRTSENEWGEHSARSDIPAELFMVDLFIHESLGFAMQPKISLLSDLHAGSPGAKSAKCGLPLSEPLRDLGTGPHAPATPEVPRYSQLIQALYDRTGWTPTEFCGFRMKIPYPAYPANLVLRYPLPESQEHVSG